MSRAFAAAACLCLPLAGGVPLRAQPAAADAASPVFRADSAQSEAIRAVEAGGAGDTARPPARADSLLARLKRRGPYAGLTAGIAFAEHSGRDLFSNYMASQAAADGQRILQRQDPVHVYFPAGLLVGFPLWSHLDATLRTEHFHYRVAGLAQKDGEGAREFWYSNQGHLAGAGLRWLVPGSLLTVNGQPGLYAAYTRFWSFGPTGMRSPDGNARAQTDPAGAGYEIQAGFQQDFDRRWILTGGFAFSRLSFRSAADWTKVVPTAAAGERAAWTLHSARFALQGLYQFGR